MTTTGNEQATTPLSNVDEWLNGLTDDQIALLRLHRDSQDLPLLVMALIRTGPLSPMEVSNGNGHKTTPMPPAIRQALGH
jgi:hypothetical protein